MEKILEEIRDFVKCYELEVSEKAIQRAAKMVKDGKAEDIEDSVYRMMSWSFDAADPIAMQKEIAFAVSYIGEEFELNFVECDDSFLLYNVEEKQ